MLHEYYYSFHHPTDWRYGQYGWWQQIKNNTRYVWIDEETAAFLELAQEANRWNDNAPSSSAAV